MLLPLRLTHCSIYACSCCTCAQVAGNGFVFGAYTHCAWTILVSAIVADPSGRSFLFSLVNATGKAVRFSLRHQDSAVQLAGRCLSFGSYVEDANGAVLARPNFTLMHAGRAVDRAQGNFARAIDALSSYQHHDGIDDYSDSFLAGREYFAAAEIEVYQL